MGFFSHGEAPTDTVNSLSIQDGSIGPQDLADEAVTTAKISPGAVTSTKIGAGAVTVSAVAGGAVGSVGLLAARPAAAAVPAGYRYLATDDNGGTSYVSTGSAWIQTSLGVGGSVTNIGAGAVGSTQLASGAVTAGKIGVGGISAANQHAAGVVDSAALASGAVTAGKIGVGGISAANQHAAGVVDNAALAANAVTGSKIADGTITAAKIASGEAFVKPSELRFAQSQPSSSDAVNFKGITVDPRLGVTSSTGLLIDGFLVLVPILVPEAATLTRVYWAMQTAGNFTADNKNRIGLYTRDSANLFTLVASVADNAALWKSAGGNSAFLSSSYAAAAGVYYLGLLLNYSAVTTAPAICCTSAPLANSGALGASSAAARLVQTVAATDLPATVTGTSGLNEGIPLMALY